MSICFVASVFNCLVSNVSKKFCGEFVHQLLFRGVRCRFFVVRFWRRVAESQKLSGTACREAGLLTPFDAMQVRIDQ